ncbi:MAG: hypothetical protein UX85_C0006G0035 [Candidatus Beckwithbacteria bacterium GW2011_GWB1_47_15]|uniref:Glycosyltransferase RgtA/B/C/D-like domain-containing protein n=1 Tax=Candidatus Beckwithbacteria bacterium GW2011_GWB1_47_15 TaxID=1618371 RepID=A0A0G1RUW8_9BACT|nr:MAG: hypothetical protein UY43_C0001G0724 [Candidatus Beckwithbacteria bacterium GW2011_GWC1_49_16]KKU35702.1 MAG: hypothetical protein UX50_C0002G0129 [Candidatus Beckwithbacteria bacterium GW2011_GWA1_46_30]KKU60901.1 MAG: hypothetical protein UX85_C0006G0035 [Candidatus Beckwithbacteria bacterium GW2011_GWB1_47_15]KKU72261.1 MAG: hypothetical protein UX97_C0001G0131 [Candidatus Beckwithbacteria bacterium GW2011_GWA2_47_25]KKW04979.1 MAG: hypothetical protein UY37_C0001G0083 [Candidatus Be
MLNLGKRKHKLGLITLLGLFAFLFLHNAWLYSPFGGYDKSLHMAYAKILTFEHRIPTYEETPESYNPPTFYFMSGKLAQVFTPVFRDDFFEALKSWQILMALLVPLAGWFWFDIFKRLNKDKYSGWLFLIWLLSLPVLNKMVPMYNLEIPQFIFTSFLVWFFTKQVLPKPTLGKIVVLGVFSGMILSLRLMSVTLIVSLGLALIFTDLVKRADPKLIAAHFLIFALITLLLGGQYYFFYRDEGALGDKVERRTYLPLWQRQPSTFYTGVFPRLLFTRPVRPYFPNSFIPIFYSDFWGDYWNYYPQRRFGFTIDDLRKSRLFITPERISRLAWQNRVNLIPTIIIILGVLRAITYTIKSIIDKKLTHKNLAEVFLTLLFVITFVAFGYINLKFANTYKGDTIKASYILYAIPVLIYFATQFVTSLKKHKLIYFSVMTLILTSIIFNLEFNFF